MSVAAALSTPARLYQGRAAALKGPWPFLQYNCGADPQGQQPAECGDELSSQHGKARYGVRRPGAALFFGALPATP